MVREDDSVFLELDREMRVADVEPSKQLKYALGMVFPSLSDPDGSRRRLERAIRLGIFASRIVLGCAITAVQLGLATGVSRGKDGATEQENRSPEPVAQLDVVPRSSSPVASPFAEQFERLDPLKDGWSTEALGEAAAKQLKQLGQLLQHPKQMDEAAVMKLADADIDFGPLRPAELHEVFSDDTLTVRRAADSAGVDQDARLEGVGSLVQSLQSLVESFDSSAEIRVTFKVFKVGSDKDVATSQVVFQATGMTSAGRLQQQAIWRCRWSYDVQQGPPKLRGIDVEAYEEVALGKNLERLFSDCTEAVLGGNASFHDQLVYGIDHWRSRIEKSRGIEVSGYQGLAVGDANGDGLDDVYVCQPGGLPNRLFTQNPDGTATDVSSAAGVDWLDRSNSALFVDLDNDGDQDLIVALDYHLLFLANDGSGRFLLRVSISTHAIPRSLCAADYDNDGDVDVYVCFATLEVMMTEKGRALPLPIHDANNGAPNALLRNQLNWSFLDVTVEVGLDQNNRRFTWAAAWEDYDNDGDQDLYVANDYGRNNLYRNDGGHFVDVAPTAAVEDSSAGMSVAWGDYNRDGRMDLYVGNMFSAAGNRIAYQRQFQSQLDDQARRTFQRHARGNSLFENVDDGTFDDVSDKAAVSMGRWAWGSLFADINNDGWEDLLVANGYVTQDDTRDL